MHQNEGVDGRVIDTKTGPWVQSTKINYLLTDHSEEDRKEKVRDTFSYKLKSKQNLSF